MSAALVLATVRHQIALFVAAFITVYTILIFIRILMSWVPRIPYYRWLSVSLRFVTEVTDPFLNLFRRFIPPIGIGGAGIDLSPMVAVFVLVIVGRIVVPLIDQ